MAFLNSALAGGLICDRARLAFSSVIMLLDVDVGNLSVQIDSHGGHHGRHSYRHLLGWNTDFQIQILLHKYALL